MSYTSLRRLKVFDPDRSKIVRKKGGHDAIPFTKIEEYDIEKKKNLDKIEQ